jgi:hypothetical protein
MCAPYSPCTMQIVWWRGCLTAAWHCLAEVRLASPLSLSLFLFLFDAGGRQLTRAVGAAEAALAARLRIFAESVSPYVCLFSTRACQ